MTGHFADHHDIKRDLGRGAFGVVYLARDTRLCNWSVTLKVLHPLLSNDPNVVRLLQNEAGVLTAAVSHALDVA